VTEAYLGYAYSVYLDGLGRGAVCHLCGRHYSILPSSTQKLPEGGTVIGVKLSSGGYIIRLKGLCAGKVFSLFSFVLDGST